MTIDGFADAAFATLLVDRPHPNVARITLNRPAQLNAYTWQMTQELLQAIAAYRDDDELRALIVRGAGDRAFCTGGDVSGAEPEHRQRVRSMPMGGGREMRDGMQAVIAALRDLDKPSIAQIAGYAVAGGLALALACDLRIAGPGARLGDTSGKFGLLPDEGGAWLFPHFMGYDRALKMTLLHEVYDAATAEHLGLVTELAAGDLDAHCVACATTLADKAPLAVRLVKMMMRRSVEGGLDVAFDTAQMAVMIANPSEDVKEGGLAFREKRAPRFRGR